MLDCHNFSWHTISDGTQDSCRLKSQRPYEATSEGPILHICGSFSLITSQGKRLPSLCIRWKPSKSGMLSGVTKRSTEPKVQQGLSASKRKRLFLSGKAASVHLEPPYRESTNSKASLPSASFSDMLREVEMLGALPRASEVGAGSSILTDISQSASTTL